MDRVQGFARHGTPIPVLRGGGGSLFPLLLFFPSMYRGRKKEGPGGLFLVSGVVLGNGEKAFKRDHFL